ncbi:MAG: hypothetical protein QME78_11455 [Thermodesulfobacteriota bacterium]|nr:hypothetical protein [Thermodesulfobacteriota bacterium]
MDGAGKGNPPHFTETKLDAVGKFFSQPMLPALIVLDPGPRQGEAHYNANFCIVVLPRFLEI